MLPAAALYTRGVEAFLKKTAIAYGRDPSKKALQQPRSNHGFLFTTRLASFWFFVYLSLFHELVWAIVHHLSSTLRGRDI